jgi:hypothetical protein
MFTRKETNVTTTSINAETLLIKMPEVNEYPPNENHVHSAAKGGLFHVEKNTIKAATVFVNKRKGAEIDTSHEYFSEITKATTKETKGSVSVNTRHVM